MKVGINVDNVELPVVNVVTTKPSYIRGVFQYSEKQHAVEEFVRSRIKWIFDFVRNMTVVGAILFLGKAAHNPVLENLGYAGCGLLWAYLMTYIEPLSLRPFHPLKNRKLGERLDLAFNLLVFVPGGLLTQYGLITIVNQLAEASAARC